VDEFGTQLAVQSCDFCSLSCVNVCLDGEIFRGVDFHPKVDITGEKSPKNNNITGENVEEMISDQFSMKSMQ